MLAPKRPVMWLCLLALTFALPPAIARAQGITDDMKPLRFQLKKISSDKPVPPANARTARPPVPQAKPAITQAPAQPAPQPDTTAQPQEIQPQPQAATGAPRTMRKPLVERNAPPRDAANTQDAILPRGELGLVPAKADNEIPDVASTASATGSVTVSGIPLPLRKPGSERTQENAAVQGGQTRDDRQPAGEGQQPPADEPAQPSMDAVIFEDTAQHPQPAPQEDADEDEPSRFASENRMAGAKRQKRTRGDLDSAMGGGKLPAEARNIDVEPIQEQQGVSPIQIPATSHDTGLGHDQPTDPSLPPEVIVFFTEGSANLEVGQMEILDGDVVARLLENPRLGLEIVGYSENQGQIADSAQRMSLSRALMLREYLIAKKIKADRLTLKGLGSQTDIEPRDRAELYFSRL